MPIAIQSGSSKKGYYSDDGVQEKQEDEISIRANEAYLKGKKSLNNEYRQPQKLSPRTTVLDLKKAREASKELSRMVLANPSIATKALVKGIFKKLGGLIERYHLDAADLEFLLEAVPDARSPFSSKYTPNRAERLKKLEVLVAQLKDFDSVRDFDSNFTQYASDLDTLMSAIGYRGIGPKCQVGPPWIENENPPSDNLWAFIMDFKKGNYLIPSIGEESTFPHRAADDVVNEIPSAHAMGIQIPQGVQDEVPGGGLKGPQPGLDPRVFTFDSYVAHAMSHGIPMRAHVSGTAPLALAATQFVMNEGRERGVDKPNPKDLVKIGGILCATFELGDFHTLAETAAGVAYFYQEYVGGASFSNQKAQKLEEVNPKQYLSMAMGFLSEVSEKSGCKWESKRFKQVSEKFTLLSQRILDCYIDETPRYKENVDVSKKCHCDLKGKISALRDKIKARFKKPMFITPCRLVPVAG